MSQKIKIENGINFKCFVPGCSYKKVVDGMPLHFFQVPLGNEGLRWREAVNSTQPLYEKSIGILRRKTLATIMHCCEAHFNVETDCTVTVAENGLLEYKIKPGVRPSIKPKQTKRLWELWHKEPLQEVDCEDMDADFLETIKNLAEPQVPDHKKEFISIVDMSTLICKNFNDNILSSEEHHNRTNEIDLPIQIKFEPMMPLTVDLMKRKSLYYMGLGQNDFSRLLQIIRNSTDVPDSLTEMKIMLTLRKHRLNEEFEALGDLFDIDKTTAQQYYEDSKNVVSDLYHSVINPISNSASQDTSLLEIKTSFEIENHSDFGSYVDDNVTKQEEQVESFDETSSESEESIEVKAYRAYKGYRDNDIDSSVNSDDMDESDTDENSDDLDYSDVDNLSTDSEGSGSVKETFDCPICKKSVHRLDIHIETNHLHPLYLNKTICGLCLVKFENNRKLRAHQTDVHNGCGCGCDMCGKMFTTYSNVKRHLFKVHLKLKEFLCDICGSSFESSSKLRGHTERAHLQIRKHACHLCEKKYFEIHTLQGHIRSAHTKERVFKCEFEGCGKSFCRSSSLNTHVQMHKSKFKCEICAKTFSFKHNLLTHSKNIHGRNVVNLEVCKIELS